VVSASRFVAISLLGSRVRSCLAAIYIIRTAASKPFRHRRQRNHEHSARAFNINHEAQRRTPITLGLGQFLLSGVKRKTFALDEVSSV